MRLTISHRIKGGFHVKHIPMPSIKRATERTEELLRYMAEVEKASREQRRVTEQEHKHV